MNREIKFRGLRSDGKGWVYGFLICIINPHKKNNEYSNYFIHNGVNISVPIEVITESVGQYTGKNDVNDIEIYEGDIIKHGGSVRIVEFDAPNYIAIRTNRTNPVLLSFCSSPTIIGNIHEHKHLLS